MFASLIEFGNEMTRFDPSWYLTATVIVTIFGLSWLGFRWAAIKAESTVGGAAAHNSSIQSFNSVAVSVTKGAKRFHWSCAVAA